MNKVAIALLTKDRASQTKQSMRALTQPDLYDRWWIDGSQTLEGIDFFNEHRGGWEAYDLIRGGPDAAIVYALTNMLKCGYEFVGICEQDTLLHRDWYGPTIALFKRGSADGLKVGAASARAYKDRILCQRYGYALMHNLGSGHVIWSREAAEIILANYRSAHAAENRAIFMQLSGIELARYWTFQTSHQNLTVDWGFDATLARHGLASLALTPQCAQMLESLVPNDNLANEPVEWLRNDQAFDTFARNTHSIRAGKLTLPYTDRHYDWHIGYSTIYAHQIPTMGGWFTGAWKFKWAQGYGPFCYVADEVGAKVTMPLFGEAELIVSGGKTSVRLSIDAPGFDWETTIGPDNSQGHTTKVGITGENLDREVTLTALTKGMRFHGVLTRFPQRRTPHKFDWSKLPPVE